MEREFVMREFSVPLVGELWTLYKEDFTKNAFESYDYAFNGLMINTNTQSDDKLEAHFFKLLQFTLVMMLRNVVLR